MKHVILFIYIFTIPALVASVVVLLMKYKSFSAKDDKFYMLNLFIFSIILATVSDMMAYYSEEFLKAYLSDTEWLLCDLLYAGTAFTWLQTKINRNYTAAGICLTNISRYFFVAYAMGLVTINTSNATDYGVMEYMDYGLVLLIVINMVLNLFDKDKTNMLMRVYSILISILVILSYLIFYLNIEQTYNMVNINVCFWFIISILTLFIILYRLRYEGTCKKESRHLIDESVVFEGIKMERNLTNRESDILREVYYGKNNQQIAEELCISENTAKAHVHNLLKKMELGNKLELVLEVQKRLKNTD